jgi:hypothetical protein
MANRTRVYGWCSAALVAIALGASGCPDDRLTSNVCAVGEVRDCNCSGGKRSVQTCNTNHRFGVCQCSLNGGGAGGSSGNGASGMSGSGAGTGGAGSGAGTGGGGAGTGGTSGAGGDAGDAADGGMDASMSDAATSKAPYSGPCTDNSGCNSNEVCVKQGANSYCAESCSSAGTCPAASGGTATVSCILAPSGTTGATMVCALSCPALTMCPTGMMCEILSGTCGWQ